MADNVKGRSYVSQARQAQAEATRTRTLAAAAELFLANGYAGTSGRAVAQAAGVSEATVFAVFGSKAGLLLQVIVGRVADDGDFPIRRLEAWEGLGPGGRLERFARIVRRAHERSWRLLAICAAAAESDRKLADAMVRGAERRHGDIAWLLREVFGVPETSLGRVADEVWAVSSVDGYRQLVVDRGRPAEDYEAWLVRVTGALV
ncbi:MULTISPECIES: TetR/AcrR family transcriptional regulator [Arthrobacter]|uniref:Helix-turn-helix domain-containing protein n=2 Tax=Arthrobacter TaxID=1663 RepID=A0ABU9KIE3_9MICC|nr:TetR/AcrR family transcriptional regulator [Arthrobacter sp. YJM1]MDP5225704.1 helix-turn-helix domain-containing protein [Arthrobacter sp. YJM1]